VLQEREPARPGVRLSSSGDPVFVEPKGFFRLPEPRMTVQFLMIVVALSGAATYVGLVAWRTVKCRMQAENHAHYLNSGRSYVYDSTELRQWHERMQRRYELAASRPWLAAETNPPPSE
jgi:hypothetical protein